LYCFEISLNPDFPGSLPKFDMPTSRSRRDGAH
jgi:hypothetical protein